MDEIKNLNKGPLTYEDWYDLGYTLVPCEGGRPTVKKWSDADFKITKEEWKNKYADKEIGLRLDNVVDLDLDNTRAKVFANKIGWSILSGDIKLEDFVSTVKLAHKNSINKNFEIVNAARPISELILKIVK